MTIKRTVDGNECEFELTLEELSRAYYERQDKFDEEDIISLVDYISDKTCQIIYNVTKEQFCELIPRMAREMRKNIDKYDMEFSAARERAVQDVLAESEAEIKD